MKQTEEYMNLSIDTPTDVQEVLFTDEFPGDFLERYDKVLLVVDSRASDNQRVRNHISSVKVAFLSKTCQTITLDINNRVKNTHSMLSLLDIMEQLGMTRRSLVIGIGGGSIGDLVGVTASIYMRGIDYCLIPTTYISMVDGVISKVALNHGHSKNLVGMFTSPKLAIVDTQIAKVDDRKTIAYGIVEMWKHALIVNNKSIINEIDQALDKEHQYTHEELKKWAYWSMKTKMEFVNNDWYDRDNIHKALSLGHTLANVYETRCNIHHAEAVTYGIIFEAIVANRAKILSDKKLESTLKVASKLEIFFNVFNQVQKEITLAMIIRVLKSDKINHSNTFNLVLPIDDGYCVKEIDDQLMSDSLSDYLNLHFNEKQNRFSNN